MRSIRILSPAKINLGLSILGKRPDGYHEIDTIMAMLDFSDVITLIETDKPGITISGMDDVPVADNLITKAIQGWCTYSHREPAFHVRITKQIPSPGGLGGGSSNAAATVRALNTLYPTELSDEQTQTLAGSLGADCPFFLGRATARATGTGTELQQIDSPGGGVVLVVPPSTIAAKTATLYQALRPSDYGSSATIDQVQSALVSSEPVTFPNGFTRVALEAFPETQLAWNAITDLTGTCSLSGAGPAVYAFSRDMGEIDRWAFQLRTTFPGNFFVTTSDFLTHPPLPVLLS